MTAGVPGSGRTLSLGAMALLGATVLTACGGGEPGSSATARSTADAPQRQALASADPAAQADALMDWAEARYAGLFPGHQTSQIAQPYRYRHYPATRNYLGVASGAVWVLGPVAGSDAVPLRVGTVDDFRCQFAPMDCLAPTAFPSRAITLVVPAAAGGPTDSTARQLAAVLSRALGQTVSILNLAGQNGSLAGAEVALAARDGHTLLLHNLKIATNPSVHGPAAGDPLRDFEFLGQFDEWPMVLYSRLGLPANGHAELRDWVQARPGRVTMAHAGLGSESHLCSQWLVRRGGLGVTPVTYFGVAPALTDLIAGATDLFCDRPINGLAQVQRGTVRAVGVLSPARSDLAPLTGVPTLAESGLPGADLRVWEGLYAPAGTPKVVLDKLNAALRVAWADPVFRAQRAAAGAVMIQDDRLDPAAHRGQVAEAMSQWAAILAPAAAASP